MNILITLNNEQQSAADSLVEDYNKNVEDKLNAEKYFESVITNLINQRVAENFKTSANRLVEAANGLPYEARLNLIKEIEEKLKA